MALVPCRECSSEVSKDSHFCPKCGYRTVKDADLQDRLKSQQTKAIFIASICTGMLLVSPKSIKLTWPFILFCTIWALVTQFRLKLNRNQ
jgi:endogenous inhibitor of DNA gyrase (YacG/DUF329 family)